MVKTIVESNGKIKEMERKWSDVLKQHLNSIDKNKEVAIEAKTLIEKIHQIREEENRKKQCHSHWCS